MVTTGHTWQWTDSIAARLVDRLSIEGGWWTVDGLALALRAKPETVRRTLFRLRDKGVVVSRRVELRGSVSPWTHRETVKTRQEWRTV